MQSPRKSSWSRGRVLVGFAVVASCGALAGWYFWDRTHTTISLDGLRQASAAGNWSRVRTGGHGYLRRNPNDAEALVLVARGEAADQRFEISRELLARVPGDSPWSAEARLREGQVCRQLHLGPEAERAFRRAIEQGLATGGRQRTVDSARLGLVQLFATEVRYPEAREMIWELYRTSPRPVAVLELLGRLDVEGTDPHEAIAVLEKFIANVANDLEARRGLAHHYLNLGRARDGLPLVEQCVASRPDWLSAWETLLGCLADLGDFKSLNETISRLPAAANETAWCWHFRGFAAEQAGNLAAAEAAYRQALQLDPFDSRLQFRLGRVIYQLGADLAASEEHTARAQELAATRATMREFYRQLLLANQERSGPTSDLCYDMGSHYEALGLKSGAAAWYREVLKRDPANAKSREKLARLENVDSQ